MKWFLFLLLIGLMNPWVISVNGQNKTFKINMKNVVVRDVLKQVENATGYRFFYSDDFADIHKTVSVNVETDDVTDLLSQLFQKSTVTYKILENNIVVITPVITEQKENTVTGVVRDEAGEPLPGVNVMIKGTTRGTVTDANGKYTISAPGGNTILEFTYLGYVSQGVMVTDKSAIDISLIEATLLIDEVVVTGYQTIAREKVTGAVTTVNAAALQERHTGNIVDNMEGRVAGLSKDGNGDLRIRGTGSLFAINRPLLVVDGLPIEGEINDLNTYDIESIVILKDAAAAAMYGARASAGIIVVTTKKPREMGRVNVDVSANFTVSQKQNLNYADNLFLTPEQHVNLESGYFKYRYVDEDPVNIANSIQSFTNNVLNKNIGYSPVEYAYYRFATDPDYSQTDLNAALNRLRMNNYAKEFADNILRNSLISQFNVAIRSMTDKYQSNLVINLKHDNMSKIRAGSNKLTIFYKGDYKMADWVSVNFSVNSFLNREHYYQNDGWHNRADDAFSEMPYSRLLNEDGSYALNNRFGNGEFIYDPAFRSSDYNALEELKSYNQTKYDGQSSRLHGGLTFNIIEGLTAQVQFVYENARKTWTTYSEANSYIMRMIRNAFTYKDGDQWAYMIPENGGRLMSTNRKDDYWTARGQVNYAHTFNGKHSIDFLAGLEFRETKYNGTESVLMGYDEQLQMQNTNNINFGELREWSDGMTNPWFYNMGVTGYNRLVGGNMGLIRENWHRYASGYTNLTYTYDGKYNVFGSFRKDYADVYGLETKFRGKPLWSIGVSWVASKEDFLSNMNGVDYLKVRGSYGITGNIVQNVTSFLTATTGTVNQYTDQPIGIIDRPANPYLTWEKTATTNFGIDFGLINSRLRGSFDWYYKKADDVYALKTLEVTTGFRTMWLNMAALTNKGVEAAITYDWFKPAGRDKFNWTTSMTAAFNKNEVTTVEFTEKNAAGLAGDFKYMEGYATSSMWSYIFGGIVDGQRMYLAPDGTKVTGNQIAGMGLEENPGTVIFSGQRDPKVTIGFDNSFRYKGFSLNIMAIYYGGHKMRCLQEGSLITPNSTSPSAWGPLPSYLLNAWTPTNTNTTVPGILLDDKTIGTETGQYNNLDIYVQNADFIKIRNIVLGYDLPKNLAGKIGMQNAAIRFQIDNTPVLWTKNSVGIDPDTRRNKATNITTYIFGLNFNF